MNDFSICSPTVRAEHEKSGELWTRSCETELRSAAGALLRSTQVGREETGATQHEDEKGNTVPALCLYIYSTAF